MQKPYILTIDNEGSVNHANTQRKSHNKNDQDVLIKFLQHYTFSPDTLNSYRRDAERFLLWLNIIHKKALKSCETTDISDYLKFFSNPISQWQSDSRQRRVVDGQPNPEWRPFLRGHSTTLSHNSIKSMLAILSTFFAFCVDNDAMTKNPVKRLKQKRQYARQHHEHTIRRLSDREWHVMIKLAHKSRKASFNLMRRYYVLSVFYLLGVRISEISVTERYAPMMCDFHQDADLNWWFKCIGKGNKQRDIAVPESMLSVLKDMRLMVGLEALPHSADSSPIIPKLRGHGGCGIRQVRNILTHAFDESVQYLKSTGEDTQANHLKQATAHWLRHTAISHDVESRPLEHVRDDAGHGNIKTTSHYITTDRNKRHSSARNKALGIYED